MHIEIPIPKHLQPVEQHEEFIANRVAMIVVGKNAMQPHIKDHGYKWVLSCSNDWHLDFDYEKNNIIVAYRYGTPRKMQALKDFLILCVFNEKR